MAGQWRMSGQDDHLSGQNFVLVVSLTGHVHGFQIIHYKAAHNVIIGNLYI